MIQANTRRILLVILLVSGYAMFLASDAGYALPAWAQWIGFAMVVAGGLAAVIAIIPASRHFVVGLWRGALRKRDALAVVQAPIISPPKPVPPPVELPKPFQSDYPPPSYPSAILIEGMVQGVTIDGVDATNAQALHIRGPVRDVSAKRLRSRFTTPQPQPPKTDGMPRAPKLTKAEKKAAKKEKWRNRKGG